MDHSDDSSNNTWQSFVSRMQKESGSILRNNKDGVSVMRVVILADRDGNPMLWWLESTSRIEPSRDVKTILAQIMGNSSSSNL